MPTCIEVCAGAGGLGTGFLEAGFTPLLLNEIDPTCCETLRVNHPGVPVVCGDMQQLHLTEFRDRVDVLMGGVPCQSFSQAGERRGLEDPRGQLMLDFNRLVLECEPKILLIENVKGLVSHDGGRTLASIVELLGNQGRYNVQHRVLNANHYGVAQKRERILIVGVRSDLPGTFAYPEPQAYKPVLRDVLQNVPPSSGASYPEAKRRVLDLVPPGGCWVNLPEDIQRSYMGASFHSGGGKRGIARRLSMDEPCLTLTTSPCQKQTDRCHPLETRPFTVREYARIQSFPDTYIFCGTPTKQYKQIGNAVPVNLARAVATQVAQLLAVART
jgi:DNA (cytosine-5)-methyltransferase 1